MRKREVLCVRHSLVLFLLSTCLPAADLPPAPHEAISPDGTRIASISTSGQPTAFRASVKLLISNTAGHTLLRSPELNRNKLGQCEVRSLDWLDSDRIAVLCSYDPQLNDYLVLDTRTGAIAPEYTGLWFRWSPDGRTLAHVGVNRLFGTNAGTDSCLYFNAASAYPAGCQFENQITPSGANSHRGRTTLTGIHAFLNPPVWSPDSRHIAFVERIFDWQYTDPYSRYLDGTASRIRYFLVAVVVDGVAKGFAIPPVPDDVEPKWESADRLSIDGQSFDLASAIVAP